MNKAAAVSLGTVATGLLAFLAANFHLEATTPVGQGILVMVGYLVAAIFHMPTSNGKSIGRNLISRAS